MHETISSPTGHSTNGEVSFDIVTAVYCMLEGRIISLSSIFRLATCTPIFSLSNSDNRVSRQNFYRTIILVKALLAVSITCFERTGDSFEPALQFAPRSWTLRWIPCAESTYSFGGSNFQPFGFSYRQRRNCVEKPKADIINTLKITSV